MAAASGHDLFLAGLLIEDAVQGRDFMIREDVNSLRWYRFYNNGVARFINNFSVFMLLMLALFEDPVSCDNCRFPLWIIMMWESICLLAILFRLFVRFCFCGLHTFVRDPKNIISFITVLISAIDMIVFAFFYPATPLTGSYPQRFSRILRPIFVINATENRKIRRVIRCIRALIKDIAPIFVMFFLIVSIFSLIFFKIFVTQDLHYFDGFQPNMPYFRDYFDTFWDLFIYVTTSNSPDVMQPAYDKSGWYSLMFVAFMALTLWGVMPIILAITYNSYLRYLKDQIMQSVRQKRLKLKRAFAILGVPDEASGEKVVNLETWRRIAAFVLADRSPAFHKLVFDILDTSASQSLKLSEFLYLSDLLNIDIRKAQSKLHIVQRLVPRLYDSKPSEIIRKAVVHPFFTYAFDLLIITNAVVLAVCSKEVVSDTEWAFLALFTFEILLKVYTVGPQTFIVKGWNIFDLILVLLAWAAAIAEMARPDVSELEVFYDLVITVRVLRVFRIIYSIKLFVVIVNTVHHILPSVTAIVALLLCVFYMFAILGMMLFAGLIHDDTHPDGIGYDENCGNDRLAGSVYASAHYCKTNFNSLTSSFVLLYDLTVVNNWHIIAEAYTLATNRAARVYFIGFYFIVINVIVNIFIAFVLEAFLLQYRMFLGEQRESRLRVHVSRYLDALSGRISVSDDGGPQSFLSNALNIEDAESVNAENTHVEWTLGDGLATISLWGPVAQEVNFGFVMRNTYRDADTLLETMLFDEKEDEEAEHKREQAANRASQPNRINSDLAEAESSEPSDENRQRAVSSVWRRSDLFCHPIYQNAPTLSKPAEEAAAEAPSPEDNRQDSGDFEMT